MAIFVDLAYAARTLRKSPVFTITAVATIALGIGAAAAIFSVTHAVLLQPLPYQNPERLVLACADMRQRNVRDLPMSTPDFLDLRTGTHGAFEDFTAVFTERGQAGAVATAPAGPQMLILSYEFWQRRFGGRRDILGRPLQNPFQGSVVIGVLQPGFELLLPPQFNASAKPDFWLAARLRYDPSERNSFWLQPIGRLREGVTMERAQAEASQVADEARRDFVIERTAGYRLRIEPMQKYLVERSRPAILALMGAVIFLLLIACANVANLVRASLRERELAVRTALGGNRWRLVRQILAEALLLAMVGTALGVGLAWLGLRELAAIGPANLPRLDSIRIDPTVTVFSALAGLAAAALFGLVPALRASRPDIAQVLRASGRTSALGGGRLLRDAVVVTEVALCFVLLIGSGLMFRSFLALTRIDPGFDPHHLLTFSLLGDGQGRRQPGERLALVRQISERLSALPGVTAVAATNPLALGGDFYPIRWGLDPALADPSKFQAVDSLTVLPGYFQTVRTPILEGRAFTEADNAPNQNVVVVDEFLARKAFGAESAVGKRILIRIRTPEPEWVRIIGVARHIRGTSLAEPGRELSGPRRGISLDAAHRRRPAFHGRSGACRHRRYRPQTLADRSAADGSTGGESPIADAFLAFVDRRFRYPGSPAGWRGALRRAGDGGAAAHRGNRRARGPGRGAGAHLPPGGGSGNAPEPGGRSRRLRVRRVSDAPDKEHAGGHQARRSADLCSDGSAVPGDRRGSELASRAKSSRPRSEFGAAGGMRRGWASFRLCQIPFIPATLCINRGAASPGCGRLLVGARRGGRLSRRTALSRQRH